MATARPTVYATIAAAFVGCGGIVDVVNEYNDGPDAGGAIGVDGGGDASASDAGVFASDGGTLAWGAESGSRLKAIWWKTDDGARQFVGWQDSLLDLECTFIETTDNAMRCVPRGPYITLYEPPSVYEDAACTIPLVTAAHPTPGNSCPILDPHPNGLYATSALPAPTGNGSCGIAYEVHVLTKPTALRKIFSGPGCGTQDPDPTLDYYEYGEIVSPSTFVASTIAPEAASTRLTFRTRTTDDGAREHMSLYDTKLGVSCGATRAADGVMRCLPDTTGDVVIYGDSSCTTPLEHCYHSSSCDHDYCGNPLPYASLYEQIGGCDARWHMYPVTGSVPDGTQVYDDDGTCSPFYIVENQPTGYVGAEIDPSSFVAISSALSIDETRLRRYVWDLSANGPSGVLTEPYGGGRAYADLGWSDSARAEDCGVQATADEHVRCVPTAAIAQVFSEDGCSVPLVKSGTTLSCKGAESYVYTLREIPDGCNAQRIFEIGPSTIETTAYHLLETGEDDGGSMINCTPFTPPASTNYFTAGADVTSQFAVFSRVIE